MINLNPKSGKTPFSEKTWNSNFEHERIGFINRDAETSETIAAPSLVNPMGTIISKKMALYDSSENDSTYHWKGTHTSPSTPSTMVLEFMPVFGTSDDTNPDGQRSVFQEIWNRMRQIYSGVEDFQPGDLQAVSSAIMHIKMQLANIRRLLRVIKTATPSADNQFSSLESWLYAFGFRMSGARAIQEWTNWKNIYNAAVAAFNNYVWIKDLVPGRDRWSALVSEIFKDTSADTDYCQTYIFNPRAYYRLTSVKDDKGIYTWTMTPSAMPYVRLNDNEEAAVASLTQYIRDVYTDIVDLYTDSSVNNIMSTINQVVKISKEDILENLSYEFLDQTTTTPVPLTWDFPMMLAIMNATPFNVDLTTSVATVNGKEGVFRQPIAGIQYDNTTYMACSPKVLNMPGFAPTNSDFANATQWMIISDKWNSEGSSNLVLSPKSYGTEIITSIHMISNYYVIDQGIQRAMTPFYQLWSVDVSVGADYIATTRSIFMSMNFAFAPITYYLAAHGSDNAIEYPVTQAEVLYAVGFDTLSQIHNIWFNNFWGFPVTPNRIGSLDLERSKRS